MEFKDFLRSEDFYDLMDYVICSRNNKLKYNKSKFDTVYEYFIYKYSEDNNKDKCMNEFNEYIPVIVSRMDKVVNIEKSSDIDSNSNDELNEEENYNYPVYNDGVNEQDEYYELNDDIDEEHYKKRYRIYNINHPDSPSVSVPLMRFFTNTDIYDYDDIDYESIDDNENENETLSNDELSNDEENSGDIKISPIK